jgi:hypothetical protein
VNLLKVRACFSKEARLANRGGEPWCGHKVTWLGANQIELAL